MGNKSSKSPMNNKINLWFPSVWWGHGSVLEVLCPFHGAGLGGVILLAIGICPWNTFPRLHATDVIHVKGWVKHAPSLWQGLPEWNLTWHRTVLGTLTLNLNSDFSFLQSGCQIWLQKPDYVNKINRKKMNKYSV